MCTYRRKLSLLYCPALLFSLLLPATTTCGEAELQEKHKGTKFWPQAGAGQPSWRKKTKTYKGQKLSDEVPSNISQFMWDENVIYDS